MTEKKKEGGRTNPSVPQSPAFVHTTKDYEYLRGMTQWYTMISEDERKNIVGSIKGSLSYGLTVSYPLLPDLAKDALVNSYESHLAHVASLETPASLTDIGSNSQPVTITDSTDSVTAVMHSLTGGKFVLRVTQVGSGFADVLDDNGKVIGNATQMYSDGGWAVHTKPFGGYVPSDQIIFV